MFRIMFPSCVLGQGTQRDVYTFEWLDQCRCQNIQIIWGPNLKVGGPIILLILALIMQLQA